MTAPDPKLVESVAKGLTKAQRILVCALNADWQTAPPQLPAQTPANFVLWHPDICERGWQPGQPKRTHYRLTPLGLAVRTHILASEKSDG
jgi:hypothetical protein